MYSEGSAETLREFPSGEEAVLGTLQTFRGYRVLESLPSSGAESDIHVIDCGGERRVLKLYRLGIEPKLEVLQKVETLSSEHPEDLVLIHETGYDERSGRWYEIQEHVPFGTLKNLLEKSGTLSEGARDAFFRDVLREISSGLAVLHDNGILHLDLKPGNVLVRSVFPLDLVLTDFGIASILDSELSKKFTKSRGTPMYQSPESITGAMGKASDWWGLGMIALEIASGAHPFRGLSQQVIQTVLTTKPVEIPESVPEGCRELLCGLLTRDMKKRWGYDQVKRWLSGERGIPHYFERSVEDSGKRSGGNPFSFMGGKYHDLGELATACAKDGESWDKGKALLLRGHIRTWLEKEGEYEQAVDLDRLTEHERDEERKMYFFVHAYGKSLPLVYMGKVLTLNNLYLYLGKKARRENIGRIEEKIAVQALDGGLIPLLDYYVRRNGGTNELSGLRMILDFLKGKRIEDAVQALDAMVHHDEYYWPFLGENPSVKKLLQALSEMGYVPWTRERWEDCTREYVCPREILDGTRRTAVDYKKAMEELERLQGGGLLVHRSSVSVEEAKRLGRESSAGYRDGVYKYEWGYDEETVGVLEEIKNKIKEGYVNKSSLEISRKKLFEAYVTLFIKKVSKVEREDKNLLKTILDAFNSDSLDETMAVSITKRLPSNDNTKKCISDYEACLKDSLLREEEQKKKKDEFEKAKKNLLLSLASLVFVCIILFYFRDMFVLGTLSVLCSVFGAVARITNFLGPIFVGIGILAAGAFISSNPNDEKENGENASGCGTIIGLIIVLAFLAVISKTIYDSSFKAASNRLPGFQPSVIYFLWGFSGWALVVYGVRSLLRSFWVMRRH